MANGLKGNAHPTGAGPCRWRRSRQNRRRCRLNSDAPRSIIIDMQRDFLEPGGFGETLGNDVSLLNAAIEPLQGAARRRARRGHAGHPHPRGPPARPGDAPHGQGRARRTDAAHRRAGTDGPHPDPRRSRPRHHPGAVSARRRAGDRQARQGRVLRDRPRTRILQNRGIEHADRLRRDHRGLRPHHGARGQRPRLSLHRAGRLLRLVLPRVPRGGPAHDQGAGRIFGWVSDSTRVARRAAPAQPRSTSSTGERS